MATTVVAVGFFALRGTGGSDDPVITRAAGDSPAVPTTPAPGDDSVDSTFVGADRPSPDSPRPKEIAAIIDGSVVVLDSRDGRTVRTLATHAEATTGGFPYLQGLSQSPDHRDVFYALAGDCGPSTIYRVGADGHAGPTAVLSGVSPAVSPDGRKLAYAVSAPAPAAAPPPATAPPAEPVHGYGGEDRQCQNAVVVRDLGTGAERTWRYPDTPEYDTGLYRDAIITKIDWAPDSTQLAYTLSYEGDTISVLDTAVDADLGETDEVVIPGGGGNSSHPAWQAGSGRLAVFNTRFECCFDDNYTGPPRVLLVDVERRLAEPLLPAGRRVTALDFDLSGAHLLFVDGGRLYRRSGNQSPVRLASGVSSADW